MNLNIYFHEEVHISNEGEISESVNSKLCKRKNSKMLINIK